MVSLGTECSVKPIIALLSHGRENTWLSIVRIITSFLKFMHGHNYYTLIFTKRHA